MKYEHIQYLLIAYHGKKPKAIYLKLIEYCKSTIVKFLKRRQRGTSLVVQWLRLLTPNAGGLGLIPGQETRYCVSQLRPNTAKKINIFLKKLIF